jgi:hypothetical protein
VFISASADLFRLLTQLPGSMMMHFSCIPIGRGVKRTSDLNAFKVNKVNPKSIMKTKIPIIIAAAAYGLLLAAPCGFSQGALTPPGAPAPTMKSLDQVEPRTPISFAPYVITQPGSYYLTTNLAISSFGNAILINANHVTLDLNGFTISSTGSGGTAILLNVETYSTIGNPNSGNTDITIFNGHITSGVVYTNTSGMYSSGPGFNNGITYFMAPPFPPSNVRVTGVSVSGCAGYGIDLGTGNSTVVESCTVNTVSGSGIIASIVSHSTAIQCGNTAISADTASDCYGSCTGSGDGLDAYYAANNCYGNSTSTSGNGIYVFQGNANNCYGYSSGIGTGLSAASANNCSGYSGNGYGLSVFFIADNCSGSSLNGVGLFCNNSAIAIGCSGFADNGIGIEAYIANSCYSSSGDGNIVNKYNMP